MVPRVAFASIVWTVIATTACAGFVLDDFDETQHHEYPHVSKWAHPVGEVRATRSIDFFNNRRGNPSSTIDINGEVASVLVSTLSNVQPIADGGGHNAVWIDNYLNELSDITDITENGLNDTIFYDFAFVEGPTPPRTIRLHAFTRSAWAIAFIRDLPLSDEPFTIAVPFSDFEARLGQSIGPDFTNVSSLKFEPVTGGFFDNEDDMGWRFGLDAIRIGTSVPEPKFSAISAMLMLLFGRRVFGKRC